MLLEIELCNVGKNVAYNIVGQCTFVKNVHQPIDIHPCFNVLQLGLHRLGSNCGFGIFFPHHQTDGEPYESDRAYRKDRIAE